MKTRKMFYKKFDLLKTNWQVNLLKMQWNRYKLIKHLVALSSFDPVLRSLKQEHQSCWDPESDRIHSQNIKPVFLTFKQESCWNLEYTRMFYIIVRFVCLVVIKQPHLRNEKWLNESDWTHWIRKWLIHLDCYQITWIGFHHSWLPYCDKKALTGF